MIIPRTPVYIVRMVFYRSQAINFFSILGLWPKSRFSFRSIKIRFSKHYQVSETVQEQTSSENHSVFFEKKILQSSHVFHNNISISSRCPSNYHSICFDLVYFLASVKRFSEEPSNTAFDGRKLLPLQNQQFNVTEIGNIFTMSLKPLIMFHNCTIFHFHCKNHNQGMVSVTLQLILTGKFQKFSQRLKTIQTRIPSYIILLQ